MGRNMKRYKILSLDGGGTWALIEALVLADLYPGLDGHQILKRFDVVVANSGGGIVVAGLMAGLAPNAIAQFFLSQDSRDRLFQELPWYKRIRSKLLGVGPQFSTTGKLQGLKECLPTMATTGLQGFTLDGPNGAPIRFLISAYDYDRDRGKIFRSDPNSPCENFPRETSDLSVVDVVHASSTAPVQYFDMPAELQPDNSRYWDGGIAAFNNPVLLGVTEALGYGVARDDIGVLSIGTANTFLPMKGLFPPSVLVQPVIDQGLATDIRKAAKAATADPPDRDTYLAYLALGGKLPRTSQDFPMPGSPIVRMNPLVRPSIAGDQWVLPDQFNETQFGLLTTMDLAATDKDSIALIEAFCKSWMGGNWQNQPVRYGADWDGGSPNQNFCEIGHDTYPAAKLAWGLM